MIPKTQKAVIYARVSSVAQLQKGDGLGSQETRCRQFAGSKGYKVEKVFKDEGASGGMIERKGMQDMLTFLRKNKSVKVIVLIDDISRLARGLEAHLQLRNAIQSAGGKLESPSIEFGEDSDSILVENLLASVSQHQRQKNAEQTLNRMKARVMNGYYVLPRAPLGYKYTRVHGHSGKVLVRDEPLASVVQEALEGFASGRFATQSEVKYFLDNSIHYPKDNSGEVRFQRVSNLLRKPIYAGFLDVPKWNIHLQQGKHEPLISFETYQEIQERLKTKAYAPTRKDLNTDFPLRGFVTCGTCNNPMTACWSKGRKTKYPYYMCFKKGCSDYRKSIRKEKVEGEFETLLKNLRPAPPIFTIAEKMFRTLWQHQAERREVEVITLEKNLNKVGQNIGNLVSRIMDADSDSLITAYESKIKSLEKEKLLLNEKIAKCGSTLPDYDTTFRTAMNFLANPHKLWASEHPVHKRTVLKLAFVKPIPYDRSEGFRTAEYSLPFKVLEGLKSKEIDMAEREGFEY